MLACHSLGKVDRNAEICTTDTMHPNSTKLRNHQLDQSPVFEQYFLESTLKMFGIGIQLNLVRVILIGTRMSYQEYRHSSYISSNSTVFWSGVGCFPYNSSRVRLVFGAGLEVVWRFEQMNRSLPVHWGQTRFGMPGSGQMSLAPRWTKIGCSSVKFKHYLRACSTSGKRKFFMFYARQPIGNHRGRTPNELKYNSVNG